jgi:hypothetical protein
MRSRLDGAVEGTAPRWSFDETKEASEMTRVLCALDASPAALAAAESAIAFCVEHGAELELLSVVRPGGRRAAEAAARLEEARAPRRRQVRLVRPKPKSAGVRLADRERPSARIPGNAPRAVAAQSAHDRPRSKNSDRAHSKSERGVR